MCVCVATRYVLLIVLGSILELGLAIILLAALAHIASSGDSTTDALLPTTTTTATTPCGKPIASGGAHPLSSFLRFPAPCFFSFGTGNVATAVLIDEDCSKQHGAGQLPFYTTPLPSAYTIPKPSAPPVIATASLQPNPPQPQPPMQPHGPHQPHQMLVPLLRVPHGTAHDSQNSPQASHTSETIQSCWECDTGASPHCSVCHGYICECTWGQQCLPLPRYAMHRCLWMRTPSAVGHDGAGSYATILIACVALLCGVGNRLSMGTISGRAQQMHPCRLRSREPFVYLLTAQPGCQ